MNFFDESLIRGLCSGINNFLLSMDDRPHIDKAQKEEIKRSLKRYAKDPSGKVLDFDIIFSFFESKRFVQGIHKKEGGKSFDRWAINTKFDDEWALSVFSEKIDLLGTGVYKLDDILKGGFRAYRKTGEGAGGKKGKRMESVSVVLQGRPGSGKTTTALLMMCNFACQGYSALYLSAEQHLNSLLRTIERFCTEFRSDEDEPSIIYCRLKSPPMSDARKEYARQIAIYDNAPKVTHESALGKFIRAQSRKEAFSAEEPVDSFVVLRPDSVKDGRRVNEKLDQILARGQGVIVISRVDADPSIKHPGVEGPIFATEPGDLISQIKSFSSETDIDFSWLVIDSVTAFEKLGNRHAALLFQSKEDAISRLFLTEKVSRREDDPNDLETSCDILIELGERNLQIAKVQDGPSNYMQRFLEIKKNRLSPFHRGKHPMAIKSDKVKVYRSAAILLKVTGHKRREQELPDSVDGSSRLIFGVDGLDGPHGLNGGIGSGSFTVLYGPVGSHKTAMCNYFLTAEIRNERKCRIDRKEFYADRRKAYLPTDVGRCLIYSFTSDRRSIIHGMRNFVDGYGPIFEDGWLKPSAQKPPAIEIHDINPGFLFPEAFVEDLLDTLNRSEEKSSPIRRIVFDSFDSIQGAYPIMRMDQFFWKVISQICLDFKVSALLKVSHTDVRYELAGETSVLLSGIADNIIQVSNDGTLRIVATEHRVHNSNNLLVERTMVMQEDSPDRPKVWLRVKA